MKEANTNYFMLDELGNKVEENKNGKSVSYEYDALSQLVKAMPETGKEISYSNDAVGNRLSREEFQATSAVTTEAVDNCNGTSDQRLATTYTYNNADELLKITEHNGKTASFEYDNNGNRVKKSVFTSDQRRKKCLKEGGTACQQAGQAGREKAV